MRFLIRRTSQGLDFAVTTPPHPEAAPIVCHPADDDNAANTIWVVTLATVGALLGVADRLIVGTLGESSADLYLDDRTIGNLPALRWLAKEGITHFVEIYDDWRE